MRTTTTKSHQPSICAILLTSETELAVQARQYLQSLEVRNATAETVKDYRYRLTTLLRWCAEHEITRVADITRSVLERYQLHLATTANKKSGQRLSAATRNCYLSAVCKWLHWLFRENLVVRDAADGLKLPTPGRHLPATVFSPSEAECVLRQPDLTKAIGIRDRAMLETLYSTGVRAAELVNLNLNDVDLTQGLIKVLEGKGRKDRLVPIGERALLWLRKYLREVRTVQPAAHEMRLFLGMFGKPLTKRGLSGIARKYVKAAQLGKGGACHVFRHSMATAMLENGADIRYIQEILGHASPSTTQIYTQVSIRKLQEVHRQTHPAQQEASHAAQHR